MVIATILSSSSKLSSPVFLSFSKKGGTWVKGLFMGWYIFWRIWTFIGRTEWSDNLSSDKVTDNPIINLLSLPVHSLSQLSFGFPKIYQPTMCTLNGIHYVIGFARQDLEAKCQKRTFGEITWKRIVGNENITCLTILASALGDFAVIRVKLVVFKHIKNLHLTWLNLDEPVCIPIP